MKFERPIVFIDIEATGADATRDRIVEIALVKIMPDQSRQDYVQRINPGIRIPTEVIAVHHITNEDVMNEPSFKEVMPKIESFLVGCDVGGFGIARFDIPMLKEEFKRCGGALNTEGRAFIDGLTIYHQKERRDLTAAYEFYCKKALVGAHGALADAAASMEVIYAQLQKYPDLPQNSQGLHEYCNRQDDRYVDSERKMIWRDGEAAINFGKHRGVLLRDMVRTQRDYVEWMVSEGKFGQDLVDICWKALRGEFPKNEKPSGGQSAESGGAGA